jgi:hypothetical protein
VFNALANANKYCSETGYILSPFRPVYFSEDADLAFGMECLSVTAQVRVGQVQVFPVPF